MARSQYVYLVLDPGLPPAAFTVKGEFAQYLRARPDVSGRVLWRCYDGTPFTRPAVELDLATLQPK